MFTCLFLDLKHRVIASEHLSYGTVNSVSVYPRQIVQRALEFQCGALTLAHKLTSRADEPNPSDLELTI
ncbi:JAB domain-containing protein [Pseudomonas sp. GM48]|uniref:JAB domain-containing protein n=1 Tax=Pseudomonas sp. GM48 TaxID=1144330 RepID=UPI0009DA062E